MVKISDIIVDFLEKNGIDVVFGIIGSANSHIYDSLRNSDSIRVVAVHHEQAAVMAMGAYYRTTGKLSAAIVTAGGGSANAFTGVLSNWADSIPGLIISGQEQSYYIDEYKDMRMYGIQGFNSVKVYENCTKLSERVTKDNVYELFHKAFIVTQNGRPGPVFIEVPFDIQSEMVDERPILPYINNSESNCVIDDVDYIVEKIKQSKRPVILAGHGIKLSKSDELFRNFLNKVNIPTLLSWSATDLLPTDDVNNFGKSGVQGQRSSNFILQNSDLVIVMGSRLSLLQTGYSRKDFAPHAHIIHIDIDSTETNKFDGKNINKNIYDILSGLNGIDINTDITEWTSYCIDIKHKYPSVLPEHMEDPTSSYTFIDEFSKKLPDNYTIVTDMGTALLSGFYGFNLKKNQKMFTSLGLGEMGYGLPAAVGASFGGNPVMCLNCDGGMMMNIQELQTIKANNLPIKIVIFNNDGYLMIKHTQNMLFSGNRIGVDNNTGLELPDYKKVAYAFGYDYYNVDKLDEFLQSDTQCILEVFMNPDQEFIPKVKGIKGIDNIITAGLLEEMSPILPISEIENCMLSGMNERSKNIKR
jgi:acetolactate synthase-1/2/3 large subunit